jgi:cell division septation protein DedD
VANKDYREIQLSSAQLAVIFIVILALGVVIFLLGVSVGKKQAELVKESDLAASSQIEQTGEKSPGPGQETKDTISKEIASHQRAKEKTRKKEPSTPSNLYYIQVAALNSKDAATSFAELFKAKGYPALVLDPFSTDERPIYRVRIGAYESREEAEDVLARLKAETNKKTDYFIVRS